MVCLHSIMHRVYEIVYNIITDSLQLSMDFDENNIARTELTYGHDNCIRIRSV